MIGLWHEFILFKYLSRMFLILLKQWKKISKPFPIWQSVIYIQDTHTYIFGRDKTNYFQSHATCNFYDMKWINPFKIGKWIKLKSHLRMNLSNILNRFEMKALHKWDFFLNDIYTLLKLHFVGNFHFQNYLLWIKIS